MTRLRHQDVTFSDVPGTATNVRGPPHRRLADLAEKSARLGIQRCRCGDLLPDFTLFIPDSTAEHVQVGLDRGVVQQSDVQSLTDVDTELVGMMLRAASAGRDTRQRQKSGIPVDDNLASLARTSQHCPIITLLFCFLKTSTSVIKFRVGKDSLKRSTSPIFITIRTQNSFSPHPLRSPGLYSKGF